MTGVQNFLPAFPFTAFFHAIFLLTAITLLSEIDPLRYLKWLQPLKESGGCLSLKVPSELCGSGERTLTQLACTQMQMRAEVNLVNNLRAHLSLKRM